ncbi:sensor histidine kinase [Marinobacter salinexigens]|uniref:histidine kinase n=1 Tax=Marinobacter salinexigens TaxID=2919747 RepID=A0A5B0VI48_9GAMM|nr:HAMP domain-containing sensor histidine kinase [Marinobacter salinexigens]KAA1174390.1 sensor histidine kinase [Marinobacter salinexigens]
MEWLTHSQTGFQQAARYLLGMRLAIATIQLVALAVAETVVAFPHQVPALLFCMLYAVLATLGWLWFTRRPPVSVTTVSAGLALDLVLIGAWLLLTGGYTNPLTSLLLLPIAMSIILVPLKQGIVLTVLGIAVYTMLVAWHSPVSDNASHGAHSPGLLAELHLFGMWITFVLTAVILLLVVGTLAQRMRQQQALLSHIRESRLRDEQIIALGLSAAAVAHRLGTPLNTMALLVDEMRSSAEKADSGELEQDLDTMEQQLALCSGHLQQLTAAAVQAKTAQLETLDLESWLRRLRESATLLWPAGAIEWTIASDSVKVAVDATLDQAILNLLANALTASPAWVGVSTRILGSGKVELIVEDHGDGLDLAREGTPGETIVTSENGLGVGLFLSNATIQRLGGILKARSSSQGTTMIIELPLQQNPTSASGEQP